MANLYADDDLVQQAQNDPSTRGDIIWTEPEALEFGGQTLIDQLSKYLEFIQAFYATETLPRFAITRSKRPLRSLKLGANTFLIIISKFAISDIDHLSNALPMFPPLADHLTYPNVPSKRNYGGMTVIDIVIDIIDHPDPIENLYVDPGQNIAHATFFFMIAHEYAHIAHGHLDFTEQHKGDMAVFFKSREDAALTFRTLEMDADSSAVSMLFQFINRILVNISGNPPDHTPIEEYSEMMIRRMLMGIFLSILITDAVAENHFPVNHPMTYVRYVAMAGIADHYLARGKPKLHGVMNSLREHLAETFILLSGDINSLLHPLISNTLILPFDQEPIREYSIFGELNAAAQMNELDARWVEIRPHLEKLKRGGTLAPARGKRI